jgi:hypothetical protein
LGDILQDGHGRPLSPRAIAPQALAVVLKIGATRGSYQAPLVDIINVLRAELPISQFLFQDELGN